MRFVAWAVVGGLFLTACGAEPLCGEDPDGNEYPVCAYAFEAEGQRVTVDYCPGDEWGAADGCNSCACDGEGRVVCTEIACPGSPVE